MTRVRVSSKMVSCAPNERGEWRGAAATQRRPFQGAQHSPTHAVTTMPAMEPESNQESSVLDEAANMEQQASGMPQHGEGDDVPKGRKQRGRVSSAAFPPTRLAWAAGA